MPTVGGGSLRWAASVFPGHGFEGLSFIRPSQPAFVPRWYFGTIVLYWRAKHTHNTMSKVIHARAHDNMLGAGYALMCGGPLQPGTTAMDPVPFLQQYGDGSTMDRAAYGCYTCIRVLRSDLARRNAREEQRDAPEGYTPTFTVEPAPILGEGFHCIPALSPDELHILSIALQELTVSRLLEFRHPAGMRHREALLNMRAAAQAANNRTGK